MAAIAWMSEATARTGSSKRTGLREGTPAVSTKMLPPVGVLIPIYLIFRDTGLLDTRIGLVIVLTLINLPIIIWMLYTYFKEIPGEILEAARMDGANEWRTFLQIVVPLSIPGLATVALFSAIGIWNNFFNALLLVDEAQYYSLQFTIYTTLNNIRFLLENADKMSGLVNVSELPSQTFRMAMAVVTVGPIIFAYPFFQRYFIRGLTLGAVKG